MCTLEFTEPPFAGLTWTVASITGSEAISRLFEFTAVILAEPEALAAAAGTADLERAMLRSPVHFGLAPGAPPSRYAIVTSARAEGTVLVAGALRARFRLELRPRAWLLHHRRNSRIFQNRYLHEIVSTVLHEHGIRCRWNVANDARKIYCTQYEETDYEFITRILAEQGILFFFEHEGAFDEQLPPVRALPGAHDSQIAGDVISGIGAAHSALFAGVPEVGVFVGGGLQMFGDQLRVEPPRTEAPFEPNGEAGPAGAGDVFTFVDGASYVDPGISLRHVDGAGLAPGVTDVVVEIAPVRETVTERVELRDFDFERPLFSMRARAGDYPDPAAVENVDESYDHRGDYLIPAVDERIAAVHLEQHRAKAHRLFGRALDARLIPGATFTLTSEIPSPVPEGSYALVEVQHECVMPAFVGSEDGLVRGCARAIHDALWRREAVTEDGLREIIRDALATPASVTYHNRFVCVPSDVAYRPARPRRPMRNVTETAVVVGPRDDETYFDRHGRIRIQFHWDRHGGFDENSTAWVRVMQTWGGAGFGFQFFPRVGMEVLVTFLGGDPDRPVVVGCLYNGTHVTPEPLPRRATRSALRTQSVPGGGGFNEIAFEDAKDDERLSIHAQRDFETVVNHDHLLNVKNQQTVSVQGRRSVGVGADQITAVAGDDASLVGKNKSENVRGNRSTNVARNETDVVIGDRFDEVRGVSVRQTGKDELVVVQGNRSVDVHGSLVTTVGSGADTEGAAVTFVDGSCFTTVTKQLVMRTQSDEASRAIRIENGDSVVEVFPDRIVMRSRNIQIHAEDSLHLQGSDARLILDGGGAQLTGEPVVIQTPGGARLRCEGGRSRLCGPTRTRIEGGDVSLGRCPPDGAEDTTSDEPQPGQSDLTLRFTHLASNGRVALAGIRFRALVEGITKEGTTRDDGTISLSVTDETSVIQVTLFANERHSEIYPRDAGPLTWLVNLVDDFAEVRDPRGARVRLRNLGYSPGADLADPELDDVTRGALIEFKLDEYLGSGEELDQETQDHLNETYGEES